MDRSRELLKREKEKHAMEIETTTLAHLHQRRAMARRNEEERSNLRDEFNECVEAETVSSREDVEQIRREMAEDRERYQRSEAVLLQALERARRRASEMKEELDELRRRPSMGKQRERVRRPKRTTNDGASKRRQSSGPVYGGGKRSDTASSDGVFRSQRDTKRRLANKAKKWSSHHEASRRAGTREGV